MEHIQVIKNNNIKKETNWNGHIELSIDEGNEWQSSSMSLNYPQHTGGGELENLNQH